MKLEATMDEFAQLINPIHVKYNRVLYSSIGRPVSRHT